jgi:hypothetical protein
MKYIYVILFCSLMIAQEFQVEGDLTVSGDINSAVIDSLQAEIESLQNIVNGFSGAPKIRTVDIEVSLNFDEHGTMIMVVPFNEVIGLANNWYKIIPIGYDLDTNVCGSDISVDSDYYYADGQTNVMSYGYIRHYFDPEDDNSSADLPIIISDPTPTIFLIADGTASNCSGTITLLVTSEN